MKVTRLPPMLCPCCAKVVDTHGDLLECGAKIKGGDFTICLECSAVLCFSDDVRTLRRATQAEIRSAPEDIAKVQRVLSAYREYCKTHPPPKTTRRSFLS